MKTHNFLPRILIIDDLFGRLLAEGRNENRATLCGQYLLDDVTGDEVNFQKQKIKDPIAQAVFCRGQKPLSANVGDVLENDLEGTLEFIQKGWDYLEHNTPPWSLVLLDLCFYTGKVTEYSNQSTPGMPEGNEDDDKPDSYFGFQILKKIQNEFPELPVIIFSSKPKDDKVMRHYNIWGAKAFLPRADDGSPEQLKELINRHAILPDQSGKIIGYSKGLLLSLRTARQIANNNRNILIRGERGTGKELFSKYIFEQYDSKIKAPFVEIDSGSLNPQLYASELFGHVKGAFTDAKSDKDGKIMEANNGILFLDEIGNMPIDVQIGLFRIIEYKVVNPVGSSKKIPVSVRFIAATNEDIDKKSVLGSFREELLDRLRAGGTLFLPPLRERKDDIPLLVDHFLNEALKSNTSANPREITPEAVDILKNYDWPGNIRELQNCIINAVNQHLDNELLVPNHLNIPVIESSGLKKKTKFTLDRIESYENIGKLDQLLDGLINFDFNPEDAKCLMGKLDNIQDSYSTFLANYLALALKLTRKLTLENPDGEILIHPAIKYVTGKKVSASKAADIIKKIINISQENMESVLSEPILKEAYDKSLKLRPKKRKNK